MKKLALYVVVAIVTFLAANYFTGCSSVNKTHDIHKETVDSSHVKKLDSSSTVSHDSSNVKKDKKTDSSGNKHIETHQIKVKFDSSSTAFNILHPYKYDIGGKVITTPEPILSATIDDTNETDSSNVSSDDNSDSTLVKSLNNTKLHKSDSTNLNKQVKDNDSHKTKTGGWPWWVYVIGVVILGCLYAWFKLSPANKLEEEVKDIV